MCSLERFKIDLKGLLSDETPLDWEVDDGFFSQLDGSLLQRGSLHVSGTIRKSSGFYELRLHIAGMVEVPCDRCLEPMAQPIDTELLQAVKLGCTDSADDDMITVDETHGVLDTAWLIYETAALAVPIRHVHQPGDCNVSMSEKLAELSAARSSGADAEVATDPRWDSLKGLLDS